MQRINSKKIAEILHSVSNVVDVDIENVSTDSRNIKKGDLFIAIKGAAFDGHDFVKEVIDKGAEVAIVEKLLPNIPAVRQIVVENSKQAYAELGQYNREQFKGRVVALTGSAGKTTTKEEIKFLLSRFAPTSATSGNFNNDVGVPKTLCDLDVNASYAVVEVGMSSTGEISGLIPYIEPDIAVVTNVYPMHMEFFNSMEEIAEAKAEIFEGLSKKGTAVINKNSNCFDILYQGAKKYTDNIVTYGEENIISVEEDETSTKVTAKIGGKEITFKLPMIGTHHVYNAVCSLTVADILGMDIKKAADYLQYFDAIEGRGKHYNLKLPNGGKYTLIDDSYSGQPESMIFAIQSLDKLKTEGRKIAVIGKMAELGRISLEKHIQVGKVLAQTNINVVITVCPETKDILARLGDKFVTYYFENAAGLDDFLVNKVLQSGDTMLIKGARYSSKLYKTAEALIKNGED